MTDAIAAAGSPPGRYTIGGVPAELGDDGRVSLPGTPYLAGSSLTMDRAIAQHRALHRPADRSGDADGVDDSRGVSRHLDAAGTVTADWDRDAACELTRRGHA